MRSLPVALAVLVLLASLEGSAGKPKDREPRGLAAPVAHLETQVAALERQVDVLAMGLAEAQTILRFVRIDPDSINGLAGPHFIIEGSTFICEADPARPMVHAPMIPVV